MVGAVNDFRGTYDVTDYRWFDLRDHDTASPNFQQHYGLLRDDYSPKPAFEAYRGARRVPGRDGRPRRPGRGRASPFACARGSGARVAGPARGGPCAGTSSGPTWPRSAGCCSDSGR